VKIPKDIKDKIAFEVRSIKYKSQLIEQCEQVYKMSINVGYDQLIRSLLILSDFRIEEFKRIIEEKFFGDPRDVITMANLKNPNSNWGINKFNKNKADNIIVSCRQTTLHIIRPIQTQSSQNYKVAVEEYKLNIELCTTNHKQ